MMVSSKGRYALRVMIYLAQNDREELIPLKEIAENQNISMKYLEMIVSLLHKGNMLISGRGKKGGYRLARKPSEYTIGSILKLTEKTLAPVNCLEGGKVTCEKAGYCITLPMWQKLDGIIDDYLETVTLEDLLEEMYRRAKALDADRLACGFRYYYESAPDREDRFLPEDMAPPEKGWLPCTPETIGKIHHGAGGMMIRRSIVEKHGIRFPEGVACEDLYFHYAVFPWCRRVCVVSRAAYVYRKRAGSITSGFASGSSLQSLDYLTVAELVLKEWKEAGVLAEYRTAFLKMLVMGVRNIRKYAPHAVQKEVTRKVADMLRQENLYRPAEDNACLSRREGELLKAWMGGKSGLDFSYYWKKMRKAGARLLRR